MRRKLSLIALFLVTALVSACSTPTAPTSNDDDCVVVVVGTQTRCEEPN